MRRLNALDWFKVGTGVLVASSFVLGALLLDVALDRKSRADLSLERLEIFDDAFRAATAITAERLPLETALGREGASDAGQRSDIDATRRRSDEALERFAARSDQLSQIEGMNFGYLRAKLKADRARVDELLGRTRSARPLGEQISVMRAMLSTSEAIEPLVAQVGRAVVEADTDLAGPVSMARTLGAFYEAASRLSAEVVPVLQNGETIPEEVRQAALRTQARIVALWDLGGSQIVLEHQSDELRSRLQEIHAKFLGKGYPYLSRAIERYSTRAPNSDWSAEMLSNVYRPTIAPIASLRDGYVLEMMTAARGDQTRSVQMAVVASALVAVIFLIIPVLVWSTYREVVRPLLQFRAQILGICDGVVVAGPEYFGTIPAVRNLYQALETLRGHEKERQRLDRESADLSQRLLRLSETDDLTGVLNRRGLQQALSHFGQEAGDYAVALCDIDHFKAVNDALGHGVGDEVLQAFGGLLLHRSSGDAVVARYGGEEFAVVLRGPMKEDLLAAIEYLRASIEEAEVGTRSGQRVRVTASFGVCFERGPISDWQALLRIADAALYDAKAAGRNRVRATNRILDALDARGRGDKAGGPYRDDETAATALV